MNLRTQFARRILLPVALCSISCQQNDQPAEATALLESVQADNYREWQRAPGYGARTPTSAPHGDSVEIFVNDVLADALTAQALEEWPVGSIVAKDGYDSDGALELIALMEKRESGWFWAEYDADGEPLYSGEPGICLDCHASGDDYVRAFGFAQ
jgi:hypothetical protein